MTNIYRPPTPRGAAPKLLQALRASIQKILETRYRREAERGAPAGSVESLKALADRAIATIKAITGKAVEGFWELGKQRDIATQAYRRFKIGHRIERQAQNPELATTAMVVGIFLLFEGCVGAGLFVADGKADIAVAFIYGFSVAAINIATGMVTGFFPCRYLGYRLRHQHPEPRDRRVRCTAWLGLTALLGVMLILNFSAGRVRATGSHKNIFDFETVSLLATFDDYYAIAIMVLGLLGGIVAIYKGWTGIQDPIPGYTAAWRDTTEAIAKAAEDIHDQYMDLVETTAENALDAIEDYRDALEAASEGSPEALAEDRAATAAHNKSVDAAILEYLHVIEERRGGHEEITRQETDMPALDLSAFEALRLPDPDPSPGPGGAERDVLAQAALALAAARDEAFAALQEIYAAFLADVPTIRSHAEKGD